jgi:serine/threonine protein kinase
LAEIANGLRYKTSDEDRQGSAARLLENMAVYSRPETPHELAAAKVYRIPGAGPEAQKAVERLRIEFEVLERVSSPHIMRLLDKDLGSRYVVAEYYPGKLAEQSARFTGRAVETLHAFRGVVEAVAQLHSEGVVHRDIKPANIFVADDGRLGHVALFHFPENVAPPAWNP